MRHARTATLLGALLWILLPYSLHAEEHISIDHLKDYIWLNNPKLSPDGESVAFIMRTANFDSNEYENQIYIYELDSKNTRKLTDENHNASEINWTRDGRFITFLAEDDNDIAQVFRVDASGGRAAAITAHETSVVTYAHSPDGKSIAFMAEDKQEEMAGQDRHLKSFEVGYDWYLADKAAQSIHLWVYDTGARKEKRITQGEDSYSTISGNIAWSPNGENILFSSQPKPHSSEYLKSKLQTINLATGKVSVLDDTRRVPRNPKYAADGTVFYSKSQGEEFYFTPSGIYSNNRIVLDIDRNVRDFYFLSENRLLVGGPDGTKVSFWQGETNGKYQKLDLNGVLPSTEDVTTGTNGEIVFVGTTPQSAPELYYMKNYRSKPVRLTSLNNKISSLNLGKVENINWTSTDLDNYYEDGVLTYPPQYRKDQKYPLVLFIHGGPMGVSSESFNIYAQSFAAQGWIVFQPNYRGSSNLGFEYQRSVINDAGDGPGRDVMAGIKKIKAMGIIDEDNIAVSGWSYGGYMTVWLTSHYQGWKAAVAGAAVTDWFDWYSMADWNVWSGNGLGGSPWLNNNAENYRRQSPITYAHNIDTPMLILSNTLDPRVTVSQSFKLWSNLKDNGVETRFIAYPIPGHSPQDPVHRRDVYRRWIDWFQLHFD